MSWVSVVGGTSDPVLSRTPLGETSASSNIFALYLKDRISDHVLYPIHDMITTRPAAYRPLLLQSRPCQLRPPRRPDPA